MAHAQREQALQSKLQLAPTRNSCSAPLHGDLRCESSATPFFTGTDSKSLWPIFGIVDVLIVGVKVSCCSLHKASPCTWPLDTAVLEGCRLYDLRQASTDGAWLVVGASPVNDRSGCLDRAAALV